MDIKPIETEYNGYKFRSRLEARWAVFFDKAGIRYEYEPEGFETEDGTRYLPDFYLPDDDMYVEVKPNRPEASKELGKAVKAIVTEKHGILLILREIPYREDCGIWWFPVFYYNQLSQCVHGCRLTILPKFDDDGDFDGLYIERGFKNGLEAKIIPILHRTGELCIAINDCDLYPNEQFPVREGFYGSYVNRCLRAAMQARFEHGETPQVRR